MIELHAHTRARTFKSPWGCIAVLREYIRGRARYFVNYIVFTAVADGHYAAVCLGQAR